MPEILSHPRLAHSELIQTRVGRREGALLKSYTFEWDAITMHDRSRTRASGTPLYAQHIVIRKVASGQSLPEIQAS